MREEVFLNKLDEEISSHINTTFNDIMKGYDYKMKKNKTKKLTFVAAAGFAIVCALGFGAYYYTPQSYISIDINPSIELETNFADKVIGTNGANEDAIAVLSAVDISNKPIYEAVKTIVEETIDQGYINNEKDNAILITVANDNEEKSTNIDEKIKTTVDEVLENTKQTAEVVDVVTKKNQTEVKDTAKQLGISVGKANVIDNILRKANKNGETNFTTEQLMNLSVKELIQLFKGDKDKIEDLFDNIDDALDDVDEINNQTNTAKQPQNGKVDVTKNKDNDITDNDNGRGNSKNETVEKDDDDIDDADDDKVNVDNQTNTAKQPQNGKVDVTKNKDNDIADNDNGRGNSKTEKEENDDEDDNDDEKPSNNKEQVKSENGNSSSNSSNGKK